MLFLSLYVLKLIIFLKIFILGFIVFIVPVLIVATEMFFSHFYMFARKGPI